MKIGKFFTTSAGTLLACQVMATPVTWLRHGDLDVSESVAANGDGSYTYNLSLVNGETSGIWFAGFYTGEYQAYAIQSSLSSWQANAFDSWLPAGEDWSLPDAADAWMVSFHDDDPLTASLVAGGTATLSFTLGGLLEAPIRYGYFVEGDHAWNRYSAVGPATHAVPEPSSLAFLGLGLLAISAMTLRRRKFHSHGPSLAGAVLAILVSGTAGAHAASDIAISQVYGGGGNSGATFTHDFIELHNRGAGPSPLPTPLAPSSCPPPRARSRFRAPSPCSPEPAPQASWTKWVTAPPIASRAPAPRPAFPTPRPVCAATRAAPTPTKTPPTSLPVRPLPATPPRPPSPAMG